MQPINPPEAIAVEVVPAQATQADSALIAQLDAQLGTSLPGVAYIVKVQLKVMPEATSQGWALYIGDFRVPKYWAFRSGIYFKVFDPRFFEEHGGAKLRFSQDGTEFVDTGLKLGAPPAAHARGRGAGQLPRQDDLLR